MSDLTLQRLILAVVLLGGVSFLGDWHLPLGLPDPAMLAGGLLLAIVSNRRSPAANLSAMDTPRPDTPRPDTPRTDAPSPSAASDRTTAPPAAPPRSTPQLPPLPLSRRPNPGAKR